MTSTTPSGNRYLTASRDQDSLVKTNVWASGPIVKDKLFFFAMYEARGSSPRNTNNAGNTLTVQQFGHRLLGHHASTGTSPTATCCS